MRLANGCDIVDIQRFSRSMKRGGERFLKRLFTARELELGASRLTEAEYWAVRFAAKEAVAKALGTGIWRSGIAWRDIEILKEPQGQPYFEVKGQALDLYQSQGWEAKSLALSHDSFALATVVLFSTE
ncbi:MAG: holo-ACP synthase [Eubacteriales bacterium]|nr:holo-ACP synthase [Eubacteriales bacterium]